MSVNKDRQGDIFNDFWAVLTYLLTYLLTELFKSQLISLSKYDEYGMWSVVNVS